MRISNTKGVPWFHFVLISTTSFAPILSALSFKSLVWKDGVQSLWWNSCIESFASRVTSWPSGDFVFETSIPLQSPVWNLIKDKVTTNRVISSTEIENISILLNWTIFRKKLLFSIKKYPDFLNAAYQNRWDSSYEITFRSIKDPSST